MQIYANSPQDYIDLLPEDRKEAMNRLRQVILQNLPEGFVEQILYKMPAYVVPHETYPAGYHCNPKDPLPFINIASQKSHIALYHMGIYADETLLKWFGEEYPKHSKTKLDMGKSCIRFKNPKNIPFDLIGELATKITPQQWIEMYESKVKR
ncbi:MAG: DUF1801 domain-containing protein [Microscillaceae bacterium]|nr:DUF1801 domain-containing protein [Microscillaceae bacterium]